MLKETYDLLALKKINKY